jgi:hypothetical protein
MGQEEKRINERIVSHEFEAESSKENRSIFKVED